jgi:hypothetical protein
VSNRRSFPITSRYHDTGQRETTTADGRTVVHLDRRFVPPPESLATLGHHRVVEGERIDSVAASELGDPSQWWRLADANGVTDPEELVDEVGTVVRITLPGGVPGSSDA